MLRLPNLLLVLLLSLAGGCSLLPEPKDETEGLSANELYDRAKAALNNGDYETAIKHFESLEARYPFGRYAQQAQLEVAYAYYKYDEPDSAIATADRFIQQHPRHPHVDYAYYLKGLVNFHRGDTFMDRLFPRDPAERDTRAMQEAFNDFSELVRRFPDSKYAEDARYRVVYLHNNLARHELLVADYYLRRQAYLAAANRAKNVLERYQRTPSAADALAILVMSYQAVGLDDLAADALRVLELNYPEHPYLSHKHWSVRG
jgi:outer membrane protein assembly factor BamD